MSPLHVQVQNLEGTGWLKFGEPLEPGEKPGSISNNLPDGRREVVFFECMPDDKSSVIYRAIRTVEQEYGNQRTLTSSELAEPIILRDGSKPYEVDIKTDIGTEATLRFTHKER